MSLKYRGRIAPSPTGYLHLGHAATFWTAFERARDARGVLVLRNEDLDAARCNPSFVDAVYEDLRWFGIDWNEGPDIGGPFAPYDQSARLENHVIGWRRLIDRGVIYPCSCSRRDILQAAGAPQEGEDEAIYRGTCRTAYRQNGGESEGVSWRFRVPDGDEIAFEDGYHGLQSFVAGRDFGDFVVWRKDGLPSYQLAVVLDDYAMGITEVVRGADLLLSTARQILLYRALELPIPRFYHCPIVTDETGARLAKRHDSQSLRILRGQGFSPEALRYRLNCK